MIFLLMQAALMQAAEPPIVVTGRALAEDEPAATVIVEREEIERTASGRLEEVVTEVGGLSTFRRSDGRSVHPTSQGLTARGLGGNAASRMTLSIDGVPQADPFGGWINFSAFDPASLSRLAVRRGAQAEPGAVAGHIAIDTLARTAPEARAAWGGDDNWDLSAVGSAGVGDGFLTVSAGFLESDDFAPIVAEDRGAADRAARGEQASGRVRLVQPVGGIELQAGAALFRDERDRGFDGSDNRAEGVDLSLRAVGRGALPFELTGWWQDRQFATRFAALDDTRDTTRIVLDQYDVPATGYGAEGRVEFGATFLGAGWRGNEGRVAERFFFVDGDPTRERRAGGTSAIASLFGGLAAGPVDAELRLDRWSIGDGFRTIDALADGASLEDARFADRDGTEWSGRVGGDIPVGTATLHAAAHRGWRLPTLNELYRPFRVGADATAANEALDPETSIGVDIGASLDDGSFRLAATLFWQRLDGAIANVPLGQGPGLFPGVGFVSGAGSYAQRLNLGAIESRGLELDGSWSQGPWRARLRYGYADPRIADDGAAAAFDGRRPPQSPLHSGALTVGWEDAARFAQLTARYEGERFDDLANTIALDDAFSLDAVAGLPLGDRLSLDLRAENLFDAEILSDIGSDGTRERARGRTAWIGIVWRP